MYGRRTSGTSPLVMAVKGMEVRTTSTASDEAAANDDVAGETDRVERHADSLPDSTKPREIER